MPARAKVGFHFFAFLFLVLLMRIERTTSPLPRECSTTELQEPAVSFLREIAAFRVSSCTNSYTSKPLTLHFPHQNAPELTRRFFNRHNATAILRYNYKILERENGIEPSYAAWKAAVLPLNYSRLLLTT